MQVEKIKDLRIIFLSSFPPRACGIADFCQNTIEAIYRVNRDVDIKVIAIEEVNAPKRDYPSIVKWKLMQEDLESYQKTALWINHSGGDVLFLEHEYGLFGGFDGVFVCKLLPQIKIPKIIFLHSLPVLKTAKKREFRLQIIKKIAQSSQKLLVPSLLGKKVLIQELKIPQKKVELVRHGGFALPFLEKKEREKLKKRYHLDKKFVILTYGLITQAKGIDFALEAIYELKKEFPNIFYLISGQPHPIHAQEKDKYYFKFLQKKVEGLKLQENVKFIPEFLPQETISNYLLACDVLLLPYLTHAQISSGVLANGMCAGCCIVSTPFPYAKEMLSSKRGFFIKFKDSSSIAQVLKNLIQNPQLIEETRKKAYYFAKSFTWEEMAKKCLRVCFEIKKSFKKTSF